MMSLRRMLLVGALVASPVVGGAQGSITVSLGNGAPVRVGSGAKFAVPVQVDMSKSGGVGVATFGAGVSFDPTRLTLDSIKGVAGSTTVTTSGAAQGKVAFSYASSTETTTGMTLGTMYFTSLSTVGGSAMTVSGLGAASLIGVKLGLTEITKGLDVCVAKASQWGDANGDGAVNIIDAQQVARLAIGLSVLDQAQVVATGDVNGDSTVNVIDAQQLARFAVGLASASKINTSTVVAPLVAGFAKGTVPNPTSGLSVAVGTYQSIGAVPVDSTGRRLRGCVDIPWSVSDTSIVRVDANGLVFGAKLGTAYVYPSIQFASGLSGFPVTVGTSASFTASALEIVQGDQQWAYRSQIAPVDPVVRVKDAAGQPIAGVPVTFSVTYGTVNGPTATQGASQATNVTVSSDTLGYARLERGWYPAGASATAATSTLTASVNNGALSRTFTANHVNAQFGRHTCMLIGTTARCWGDGTRGQLGNGGTGNSSVAVTVSGSVAFARLSDHTASDAMCGIATDGKAYCWGDNSGGQLGDSSRTQRNVPTLVAGGLTWSRISLGALATCGLTTAGAAYCWGTTVYGQLGDSTVGVSATKPVPVRMPSGVTFTELSTGFNFSCALTTTGATWCWGYNGEGELGDGTTTNRLVPVQVVGAPAFVKISAGVVNACGLTSAGAAWCWGDNANGQIGNGTVSPAGVVVPPTAVGGSNVFSSIAVGNASVCAQRNDGATFCWGYAGFGSLGINSTDGSRTSPVAVATAGAGIFMGARQTCTVATASQTALCWGQNTSGQLGDGTSATRIVPTPVLLDGSTAGSAAVITPTASSYLQNAPAGSVVSTLPAVQVSDMLGRPVSGVTVSFAVTKGGGSVTGATAVSTSGGTATVGGWTLGSTAGMNELTASVDLGGGKTTTAIFFANANPTTAAASIVRLVADTTWVGAQAYSVPNPSVRVLDASNQPVANATVQFAYNSVNYPVQTGSDGIATLPPDIWSPLTSSSGVPVTASVSGVSGSVSFVWVQLTSTVSNRLTNCAVASNATAYCWGQGLLGQLGDGTTTSTRGFAKPVAASQTFASMALGESATKCALTAAGAAWCWGANEAGQVGDGTVATSRSTPTAVSGTLAFTSLVTQGQTSCGLVSGGQLYCWGWMQSYGLGDSTLAGARRTTPTLVNTGTLRFTSIALVDDGFCGVTSAGDAYCSASSANLAVSANKGNGLKLVAGGLKWSRIVGGTFNFCALATGGIPYCWGANFLGGLGDGTSISRADPYPVAIQDAYGFVDLVAGNGTGCALRADGTAFCWGNNASGQLGRGTNLAASFPDAVAGFSFSSLLPFTFRGLCGQILTRAMYCWGSGQYGELGDSVSTGSNRATPVQVIGWPDGASTATPATIKVTNAASWSLNGPPQAYPGTAITPLPGVVVLDRSGKPVKNAVVTFSIVAGGGTAIGTIVKTDSTGTATVGSWTAGATATQNIMSAKVDGLVPVQFVASATSTACNGCRTASFTVASGNSQTLIASSVSQAPLVVRMRDASGNITGGQVTFRIVSGAGTLFASGSTTQNTSVLVGPDLTNGTASINFTAPSTAGTTTISATLLVDDAAYGLSSAGNTLNTTFTITTVANPLGNNRCELTSTGAAYCWGDNSNNQVGDGTTTSRSTPTAVSGGLTFASLAEGGSSHMCGLTSAGAAYCWGYNAFGQLGDSTTTNRGGPTLVKGGLVFTRLAMSRYATCGLTSAGALYCWGWGNIATVSDSTLGTRITTPKLVPTGGVAFKEIAMGNLHSCAIGTDNLAYCWGNNASGQLGDGTTTSRSIPARISDGRSYKAIAAADSHSCGVTTGGAVYCWGRNDFSTIGDGTTAGPRTSPIPVASSQTFASISASRTSTCALTTAGQAWCWGDNASGQLGDGTTTVRSAPVALGGGITLSAVRMRESSACGRVSSSGQPMCWGSGAFGNLGNGLTSGTFVFPASVNWVEGTAGVARSVTANSSPTQTATAGSTLSVPPTVIVKDYAGNPVSGVTVTFGSVTGGGTITTTTVVTGTNGTAQLGSWTIGSTPGTNTVTATVTGLGSVTFTVTGS